MKGKATEAGTLFLIVLLNIIGYSLIMAKNGINQETIVLGSGVIALILLGYIIIRSFKMGDPYIFLIVSCLLSIGIFMLFRLDPDKGYKQVMWFAVAIVMYYAAYFVFKHYKNWDKRTVLFIGTSILLFIATLVFGKVINGARNWIIIGGMSFQPSELIRVLYVLALSSLFAKEKTPKQRFIIAGVVYMHLAFLILQREWGITLLFFLVYFVYLVVCTNDYFMMLLNLASIAVAGVVGYFVMYHIKVRVDMWLNPFADPTGKGFQILQSLFGIASGGFMGTGLGLGHPYLIPFVESDFIFAAICEEFGILGATGVIMLYFILVYRGFKVSLSVENKFQKLVAFGISAIFAFQIFIIVGGVIKFIPLTGITLPFISYGGSSLVTSFIALGILQAISSKVERI